MALEHVNQGERLRIRASDFNLMIDAARVQKLRQSIQRQSAGVNVLAKSDGQYIQVKNTASVPVYPGGIIAIEDVLHVPEWVTVGNPPNQTGYWKVPPQFAIDPVFKGVKPTANHRGSFAVAVNGIRPNEITRCLISGVVVCQVRMQEDSDRICDIKVDTVDMLESSPWGSGKILYSVPLNKRNQQTPETKRLALAVVQIGGPLAFISFRAEVIDVDTTTWGAGRKKLKVKRLVRHPRGIDGPEFVCDGGIDTLIGCGDQVLVQEAQYVFGDPIQDQYPPLVATPITAHDQSNMPQPDPTATAFVPTPGLPLLPDLPCTSP